MPALPYWYVVAIVAGALGFLAMALFGLSRRRAARGLTIGSTALGLSGVALTASGVVGPAWALGLALLAGLTAGGLGATARRS